MRALYTVILYSVASLAALSGSAAQAAVRQSGVPHGYAVVVKLRVEKAVAGVEGWLEILEDRRVTPALRAAMWGTSDDPGFVLPEGDALLKRLQVRPLLTARLRLLDAAGHVLAERDLGEPLAEMKAAYLYGTAVPTFLVTADKSIGMGPYAGPATDFFEVRGGKLQMVRAVDAAGKSFPIGLISALERGWRVVDRAAGGKEIETLSTELNPDENSSSIIFHTYRFDRARWRLLERREPGFWENECEDSDCWPERSKFP